MQTIYVLVFLLGQSGYNSAVSGVSQIEYTTLESCVAAKEQIKKMNSHRDSVCIEKQTPQTKITFEGGKK